MSNPLTANSNITISLACNLWDGRFLGFVTGFGLGELELVNPSTDWSMPVSFDYDHFNMESERFLMLTRERNQPEMSSDQIVTTAGEFCRLLNWARANDFYRPTKGPIAFWQVWRAGQMFMPGHLKCLFD